MQPLYGQGNRENRRLVRFQIHFWLQLNIALNSNYLLIRPSNSDNSGDLPSVLLRYSQRMVLDEFRFIGPTSKYKSSVVLQDN